MEGSIYWIQPFIWVQHHRECARDLLACCRPPASRARAEAAGEGGRSSQELPLKAYFGQEEETFSPCHGAGGMGETMSYTLRELAISTGSSSSPLLPSVHGAMRPDPRAFTQVARPCKRTDGCCIFIL